MAIGTGTVTADVEATATLTPSRGRVRLPRSPKILTGLGILAFFVLLAIIGPFVRPYSPEQELRQRDGPAGAVGRALARHHAGCSRTCSPSCSSAAGACCSSRSSAA